MPIRAISDEMSLLQNQVRCNRPIQVERRCLLEPDVFTTHSAGAGHVPGSCSRTSTAGRDSFSFSTAKRFFPIAQDTGRVWWS